VLTCRFDDPDETADGQEETALSEGEWRGLENTMRIGVEQQAKLEANSALADQRFAQAERRLDGWEPRPGSRGAGLEPGRWR
jgi:hypothetical protein